MVILLSLLQMIHRRQSKKMQKMQKKQARMIDEVRRLNEVVSNSNCIA